MAARRLVAVLIVLLLASTLAAALAPVAPRVEPTNSDSVAPTDPPRATGAWLRRAINARAAKPRKIALTLGDQLTLTVAVRMPDQVEIARLGELEDAEPGTPAGFDLLPSRTGSFPVRLLATGRTVARIVVRPRRERAARAHERSPRRRSPESPTPRPRPRP